MWSWRGRGVVTAAWGGLVAGAGRRLTGLGTVLGAVVVLAACSGGGSTAAPSVSSAAAGVGDAPEVTAESGGALVPAAPLPVASPDSKRTADLVGRVIVSDAGVAACVAARLDENLGLRDALGETPQASQRWSEAVGLHGGCVQQVKLALSFAEALAASPGVAATAAQLACVRDRYAALSPSDMAALVRSGLTPATADVDVKHRLVGIVTGCGIDPAALPGNGR